MNMTNCGIALALAAAHALSGCESTGGVGGMSREQTLGTAGGVAAGGLAGYLISGGLDIEQIAVGS